MMGSNDKPQDELFYSFNLEEVVPQDHLLRQIDQFLDFSELREHLAPYYSHTGRPSVVLQAEHLGPGSGSLDILEEPAWAVPGVGSVSPRV